MKKIIFLLLAILGLSSCQASSNIDPEILNFLNNINFEHTFNYITDAEVNDEFIQYNSEEVEIAKKQIKISYLKDKKYSIKTLYSGELIKDNIKSEEQIIYCENTIFYKEIYRNDSLSGERKQIDNESASEDFLSFFYTKDDVYKRGGFYYAEYFASNIKGRENSFKLNENNDELEFQASDDTSYKGTIFEQKLSINNFGMLVNCYQKMSFSSSNEYAISKIEAKYNQDVNG